MTIALRQRPLSRVVMGIVKSANGAWFDPSDLSTLYQDAAGTKPVTAVEQPVGLMLDKARGMMLGPELVVNGDFSNGAAGWVLQSGWSISDGRAVASNPDGTSIYQTCLTIGRTYKISFSLSEYTVGALRIFAGYLGGGINYSANGNYTTYLICKGDDKLYIQGLNLVGSIDNISVRELYGNHATQSVTASRPVLSARKNVLLATETLATQSVTSFAAQYTLSFTGTGSVTLSGTATGTLTGTGVNDRVSLTVTPTAGTLTLTVSGSVTKAQLELGASAGPYQRVNTATDYDTNERYFPKYLRFDGVDDYLNLPYMGLYANGSASVVVATDLHTVNYPEYLLTERSTAISQPAYLLQRKNNSPARIGDLIRNDVGSLLLDDNTIPISQYNVLILTTVDAGALINTYVNGVVGSSIGYTRTGTLTLNKTTIGASVSTAAGNYSNMKLYSLIITKSALTDAQRVKCERYAASKSGVIL